MSTLKPKHCSESEVVTRHLVMPRDANPLGSAFGGLVMSLIDETAYMAASRHCETIAVTASLDSLSFLSPLKVGDHVVLYAKISYTGKTSMEVSVRVEKENPATKERVLTTTAYLTFVALSADGKPVPVPQLLCNTDQEREALTRAAERVAARKVHRSRHDEFTVCS
jgi:acyl-CoA hydrolase